MRWKTKRKKHWACSYRKKNMRWCMRQFLFFFLLLGFGSTMIRTIETIWLRAECERSVEVYVGKQRKQKLSKLARKKSVEMAAQFSILHIIFLPMTMKAKNIEIDEWVRIFFPVSQCFLLFFFFLIFHKECCDSMIQGICEFPIHCNTSIHWLISMKNNNNSKIWIYEEREVNTHRIDVDLICAFVVNYLVNIPWMNVFWTWTHQLPGRQINNNPRDWMTTDTRHT